MIRHDGRQRDELRLLKIERHFTKATPGSVLIEQGGTTVLCTASLSEDLPAWISREKKSGWITAEYNMLPGSTHPRKTRERTGKIDGRTSEIQRLIGRSLRAVADLGALGPRLLTVDCDVLQADGGTRTASITGALVAVVDAIKATPRSDGVGSGYPLRDSVAAVSTGLVEHEALLDLDYREDFSARVDMNIVMTGQGQFVEIQGAGEKSTFDQGQLQELVGLARRGLEQLRTVQRQALGQDWPFP